ncbi:MAG: pdhD 2 [Bacillota bacterium]|nr:pdhD 2 [Bacillota bacterium]
MKIAVIGGGPGGYVAAIRAAQLGAEVTLIEKNKLGGTCLNVGCIPTKALLHSAGLLDEIRRGTEAGIIAEPKLDFSKTQEHKSKVVNRLVSGVGGLMKANKIKVIMGTASFVKTNLLQIVTEKDTLEEAFDKVIIASGSVPAAPPIPGASHKSCIDSTGALALKTVPESMVIIGGGVIGVELATAYASFGAKITIVEMMPEILPMMDGELTQLVRKNLERKGIKILTSTRVISVEDMGKQAGVKVETKNGQELIPGEKVLICIGRRPDTEALGLDKISIAAERGRIKVNEFMQTSCPDVYAVGDCASSIMLAHIASAQGELAAEHAMGHPGEYFEQTNPSCIYTEPEFASVGLTEEKAKEMNLEYIVGRFPLAANGKALIMNGGEGMIKIIANNKYKEVLGVHILGPRATDLIAEGALAIRLEATLDELITTIHAHPTLGEAVRETALAAEKRAIHAIN